MSEVRFDCALGRELTPEEIAALPQPEPLPLEQARAQRLTELADYRWQRETGGTTLNGTPIATDRDSQAKLTAAWATAKDDPAYTIDNWKVAPGVFVTLDAATIIAAGEAARAHVQACFDREAVLSGEILACATTEDVLAIDITTGWPS